MKTCLHLGEMTVLEVRKYLKKNRTVILPYGVVEQHGYHLPLDTDIRNANFLGEALGAELGCVVAPALPYCFSGGMLEGTINVHPNTFCAMIRDIVKSLVVQGFNNVLILPGHGGSESFLELKEALRIGKWLDPSLHDVLIMLLPAWEFSPTWQKNFLKKDYHAARVETSLIMNWSPEVVRDDVVLDTPAVAKMLREDPDSYQERTGLTSSRHEVPTTKQKRRVSVGVMGYPHEATPALGKQVTDEVVRNGTRAIRKAIAQAERNRKSGRRVPIRNTARMKLLSA